MERTFYFRVDRNLKIQVSNGQNFKFLTVKNSNSVNTGEKTLKQFIDPPDPLVLHIMSCLSYRPFIMWFGHPCSAVNMRIEVMSYMTDVTVDHKHEESR